MASTLPNYVEECDRQLRVYGESVAASGMRGGETSDTHHNIPGKHGGHGSKPFVWSQEDQCPSRKVGRGGNPSGGVGGGIAVQGASGYWCTRFGIGILMPLMMLCNVATSVMGRVGILLGSFVFVGMGVCSWWYWLCVLPWLAVCGLCLAVMSGWCFGLIELAGN